MCVKVIILEISKGKYDPHGSVVSTLTAMSNMATDFTVPSRAF